MLKYIVIFKELLPEMTTHFSQSSYETILTLSESYYQTV